ncbi:hypothetical protein PO909_027099, partial [Leuciscus waleckii]
TVTIKVCVVSVSLQETVEAVIGGSVLLPCSSTEHDHKLQDINVFWRHNGEIVCDIIPSSRSLEKQDPEYKNRTETFPEEYERGNFSIKLHKLIYADAGEYTCLISHSSEQPTVQLIIMVSLQETVEAVIGGSVLLPCSSTDHDLKLQDTDVHWRDNNDMIVYSIMEDNYLVQKQCSNYENRTESFPGDFLS